ncbi:MAG: hypothetical protein LBT52_01380 [Clostridiales Family XIII bacterium]|jgi:hypothetical protein|nr:hypothetical protein [Clostridiales Family XIII bacterium]
MNLETYSYILAGGAMIIVLYFAMRLRKSIKQDQDEKRRRERYVCGPALVRNRYYIKKS